MEKDIIFSKKYNLILLLFLYLAVIGIIYVIELRTEPSTSDIVKRYRAYRITYSLITGLIIGGCGAFLQSSMRNPLVDHYILGIGSGALFFYYLSLVFTFPGPLQASMWGIIGGLLALTLTTTIAQKLSGKDISYVLSGLAVNSLFSGFSMTISYIIVKKNPYAPYYFLGSFILSTKDKLVPLSLSLMLILMAYVALAKPLNALLVSDEHALQLNYNPRDIRLASSIFAGAASSIAVSLFGLLGFVGLASPHISRMIFQTSDNRVVIPTSMVTGSLIVYLTDFLSRRLFITVTGEIPAGAITSVIGAPFFLILLITRLGRTKR